jgi:hypothetical protein
MEDNVVQSPLPNQPIKGCIKGGHGFLGRIKRSSAQAPSVRFLPILDNNQSLDSDVRERIEHNLKYKDDTIFENLEIFRDLNPTVQKVSGKKDNFNAKSLLATKPEDIPISDDEEGIDKEIEEQKVLDEAGSLSFTDYECIENKAINHNR